MGLTKEKLYFLRIDNSVFYRVISQTSSHKHHSQVQSLKFNSKTLSTLSILSKFLECLGALIMYKEYLLLYIIYYKYNSNFFVGTNWSMEYSKNILNLLSVMSVFCRGDRGIGLICIGSDGELMFVVVNTFMVG